MVVGSKRVHRVNDTGNPTQDGQTDVDQEIRAAATLQEDTQRGQDDGEDDLANVTRKGIFVSKKLRYPGQDDDNLRSSERHCG